ncbi:alpha/beta fold hydrolase [Hymenobacter coccineus]|uniref:Esterase n=1 Tax=Hymenobacter coccineus TaxID=1908235 RepID=A0A1G1TLN2_9BACT|nr:alpha/beta fold hydrolase [Hymenobacter coccineus]OGX91773.1 esterase [Hymenobacter coccineus]
MGPADVRLDSLALFDSARQRVVPVALYFSSGWGPKTRLKAAILSHGYGGTNTAYSCIARNLVAQGYFVASIQHELPTDEPIPTVGPPQVVRRPNWERGVQNILFVRQELRKQYPRVDFGQLLLVGHSNGGDMAMLFAQEHPALVRRVVSLDSRRMPFPRARRPRVLSLRSSDQVADPGVLPTPAEQRRFGTAVAQLPATLHNDMWDGATPAQQQEMNALIARFLAR